jgi:hypothetical protein
MENCAMDREVSRMHAWPDVAWICTTWSAPSTGTSPNPTELDRHDEHTCLNSADLLLQDVKPWARDSGSDVRVFPIRQPGAPTR